MITSLLRLFVVKLGIMEKLYIALIVSAQSKPLMVLNAKTWSKMMDEQDINRIKRKVAKLMALADNTSNEHEASSAMRKAALLMANYHVEAGDLNEAKIVMVKKPFFKGRKLAMANEQKLFWAIAENMGVYGLYYPATRPNYYNVAKPCHFELIGNASDIEITWYLFEICNNQIINLAKAFRQQYTSARADEVNDYKMGLTIGLKNRFVIMGKTDLPKGKGLVPVDNRYALAEQHYNEIEQGKSTNTSIKVRQNDHLRQGANDSKNIHLNAGVNGEIANVRVGSVKRLT